MIRFSSRKLKFSLLIIFLIIVFDQLAKVLVLRSNFNFVCNTGFAFGIFQDFLNGLIAFLVLLVVVCLFLTSAYSSSESGEAGGVEKFPLSSSRLRSNNNFTMLALALIIGGGASNIVDRLIRGCVVDFLQWSSQTWLPLPDWLQSSLTRWPAFNLADATISVGTIILILSLLKKR